MQTTQHRTTCPVYLHPTAANNPSTVRNIQRTTGQLVVIAGGRPQLKHAQRDDYQGFSPFNGGDAA